MQPWHDSSLRRPSPPEHDRITSSRAYAPTTTTAALELFVRAAASGAGITFTPIAAGVLEAVCDACPRDASHVLTVGELPPVFVCRSHAKIAADALAELVAATS